MAKAEKDLSDHLERIRADIASLSETVSQLVSDTAGIQATLKRKVGNAAKHASAAGGDILHEAAEMGGDAIHAAAARANSAVHGIEHTIERNPVTAVLAALGFGFIVGLISRK